MWSKWTRPIGHPRTVCVDESDGKLTNLQQSYMFGNFISRDSHGILPSRISINVLSEDKFIIRVLRTWLSSNFRGEVSQVKAQGREIRMLDM